MVERHEPFEVRIRARYLLKAAVPGVVDEDAVTLLHFGTRKLLQCSDKVRIRRCSLVGVRRARGSIARRDELADRTGRHLELFRQKGRHVLDVVEAARERAVRVIVDRDERPCLLFCGACFCGGVARCLQRSQGDRSLWCADE